MVVDLGGSLYLFYVNFRVGELKWEIRMGKMRVGRICLYFRRLSFFCFSFFGIENIYWLLNGKLIVYYFSGVLFLFVCGYCLF